MLLEFENPFVIRSLSIKIEHFIRISYIYNRNLKTSICSSYISTWNSKMVHLKSNIVNKLPLSCIHDSLKNAVNCHACMADIVFVKCWWLSSGAFYTPRLVGRYLSNDGNDCCPNSPTQWIKPWHICWRLDQNWSAAAKTAMPC